MINTITVEPSDEPQTVWTSGDVTVSAIRATHIPGNVAYRVDAPAGSVVIGGDAVNDVRACPRSERRVVLRCQAGVAPDIAMHVSA